MRLTTKGRFAVSAMLDLALHGNNSTVCLTAISERQHISLAYLEQLFGKLRRAGLINSVRGPGGGYKLAHPSNEINVAQIIAAAEDSLDATQCNGKGNCLGDTPCLTHDLWENLNKTIESYLTSITLAHLIQQNLDSSQGIKKIAFTDIR